MIQYSVVVGYLFIFLANMIENISNFDMMLAIFVHDNMYLLIVVANLIEYVSNFDIMFTIGRNHHLHLFIIIKARSWHYKPV